jgi:hypothetical protein
MFGRKVIASHGDSDAKPDGRSDLMCVLYLFYSRPIMLCPSQARNSNILPLLQSRASTGVRIVFVTAGFDDIATQHEQEGRLVPYVWANLCSV